MKQEIENFSYIEEYNDYKIGDNGTVLSIKNGTVKVLKPTKLNTGYLVVNLCKNGEVKMKTIHSLVAQTFIKNTDPVHKIYIDHIDGNKLNNSKENLRWCTPKENNNNPITLKRRLKFRKSVICYNNYGIIKVYISMQDVKNDGYSKSAVCSCCKGKRKSHKGYQFRYADENEIKIIQE